MSIINSFLDTMASLASQSGFAGFLVDGGWKNIIMILISFVFMYLAIAKGFEPLLLLPISFGMLLTNLPYAEMYHPDFWNYKTVAGNDHYIDYGQILQKGGLLDILYMGVKLQIYPPLIFLGIGAMTDFGPLIASPKSFLMGAAAQGGIFFTFIGAALFGMSAAECGSIAIIGGADGPYRQSERRDIYKKYVQVLLENGKAYIAFDTPEELDAKRAEIANFQYDASTRGMMRNSLTMPEEEVDALIAEGKQYVVRFKIEPNEDIRVNDLIRGEVIINSSILDDKVLYKSADELPTYHLANIVDDHLMEVSHVIRGEEWLPSAPLHVLLYRAFGWEDTMPEFAHLPLLLKPEGNGKLSKRDGDRLGFPVFPLEWHDPKSGEISSGYRESGYLSEAVINFLALLGWNPGNDQEVMSMEELIKLFDLHRCSKSGAKFDYKKGIWFNHQYIQQKPNEEIAELFLPFLKEQGVEVPFEKVVTVVGMMKDRVSFIKELWGVCSFFFVAPTEYDEKTVKKRWKEDSAKCMTELAEVIAGIEDFSIEGQEKVVMDWIAEKGYHTGNIMNAFRLTLVGEGKGPHMFDISWVLGKEETIARIKRAVEVLK